MFNLKSEIRINDKYAHLYSADYVSTEKEESIPKINEKVLLTPDYLRRMAVGFGAPSASVLPPNCRYLEKFKKGTLVVIEEPPAFRTVRITMGFSAEINRLQSEGKLEEYGYDKNFGRDGEMYKPVSLTLALPYSIFMLYINNYNELTAGQIFFRVARLVGMADYLLKVPFTNIADSQYICFGSQTHGQAKSLNAAVEKTINAFWSAEFNTDYTYNYKAYQNTAGVNSYMEWQALSQINPMFIYDVDWIKIPMSVGEAVSEIKRHYKLSSSSDLLQYKNIHDIFSVPLDTGKDEAPTPRSKQKYRLFYDVAEGISLSHNFYIHVGDPFYIKHGKQVCHVNSFINFMEESGEIKYIRVERDDGRLITHKYTRALKAYLLQECKKLRYEAEGILKNGVVIKENDILIMKNAFGNDTYKRVSFIRKSREGFHEGRFGDGFYILENTEATIFDVSKPIYNGIELNIKSQYVIITSSSNMPYCNGSVVKFNKINTDSLGKVVIELKHIDSKVREEPYYLILSPPPRIPKKDLYSLNEVKPLPKVFRHGRKLKEISTNKQVVFGSDKGILIDGYYRTSKPTIEQLKKYLLEDDKFHVQSFDLDVEFAIGDKVVVADWDNPVNMLSIKIIQGFKFDESCGDIYFILADRQGTLYQERYVDGQGGSIFVGRIRKITNSFGNLTAGTKIKAKESSIPHFPMKDTNIIIGFITDTGGSDPLVLCSNCCTVWYSDISQKFQTISMKSKKWKHLQHAPIDVSKIKFQAGDILKADSYGNKLGWLVCKSNDTNTPKILDLKYYASYPDYYTLDRYTAAKSKLDCIPNPRISPKTQNSVGLCRAWPNLHGHYFTCDASALMFINDERSIVNVQSCSE